MKQRAISPAHLWQPVTPEVHRWRPGPDDAVSVVVLVVAWVAAAALMPPVDWGSPIALAIVLAAGVVAAGVHFDVRSGWCSPLQLVLVPLWLLVPPASLSPVVALLVAVGVWMRRPWVVKRPAMTWQSEAAMQAVGALGAALVLSVRGVPEASPAGLEDLLVVFGGQVAATLLWSALTAAARRERVALHAGLWVWLVDGALLPVGFLVAFAMAWEPVAALMVVPLVLLLAEFSRERDERLLQALELSSAYRGSAQLMATMMEDDHAYTGGQHSQGVVDLALEVGRELRLSEAELRDLEFGALLHDIGKLNVPNVILNKPGSLTDEEWEIVRRHPADGQAMLDRVGGALEQAGRMVRSHHERFDGGGYPDGLAGDEIPHGARVITACDAWNAMTTDRSYRRAMSSERAAEELERCAGGQFDPVVVAALMRVLIRRGELSAPAARPGRWARSGSRALDSVGGNSPSRSGR